jgi:hypothetical protein
MTGNDQRPIFVPHERRGRHAQIDQPRERVDEAVDTAAVLQIDDRERSQVDDVAGRNDVGAPEEDDVAGDATRASRS